MTKKSGSIRSTRIAKRKQPKLVEGTKNTMIIRGNKSSPSVQSFLKDIRAFRRNRSVFLSHKHEIQPFEDTKKLQDLCEKSDCSLFLFGSHSKKRPNNIVIGRTYNGQILDMVQFGIIKLTSFSQINSSINIPFQIRPFLIFQGDIWETDEQCSKTRNLLNDFFFENQRVAGMQLDQILEVVISFSIFEEGDLKKIVMKIFETKIEGKDLLENDGKIVMETLGPNAEFAIRRSSFADAQMWKKATYTPKPKKKKQNKNIKYDSIGNKMGKVYVDRQDLKTIQSRKRKVIQKRDKAVAHKLQEKNENQFADK